MTSLCSDSQFLLPKDFINASNDTGEIDTMITSVQSLLTMSPECTDKGEYVKYISSSLADAPFGQSFITGDTRNICGKNQSQSWSSSKDENPQFQSRSYLPNDNQSTSISAAFEKIAQRGSKRSFSSQSDLLGVDGQSNHREMPMLILDTISWEENSELTYEIDSDDENESSLIAYAVEVEREAASDMPQSVGILESLDLDCVQKRVQEMLRQVDERVDGPLKSMKSIQGTSISVLHGKEQGLGIQKPTNDGFREVRIVRNHGASDHRPFVSSLTSQRQHTTNFFSRVFTRRSRPKGLKGMRLTC